MNEATVKKDYSSVSEFIGSAELYRAKTDGRGRPVPGTIKIGETSIDHSIDKVLIRLKRAIKASKIKEKLLDKCDDIRADNCMTIEKEGKVVLLKDADGKHLFSPEQEKIVNTLIREQVDLFNEKLIEFEPYMAKSIPNNLTMEQVEAFKGFVIPQEYELSEPAEKPKEAK